MKITIVGAGNAGMIHAAKLLEKGHEICILKTSEYGEKAFFDNILETEKLKTKFSYKGEDIIREFGPLLATYNVEEALNFADLVFVLTTVSQHEQVAQLIAPYVRDGQILVLCPSYMSSLVFKKYISKNVTYAECETTAYNGRIVNHEFINVTFFNPRNAVAVTPKKNADQVIATLENCFSNTKYLRENALETALHNPNMIVHTIGVTLSSSRIEHSKGEFWMYKEAFTPSVVNVIRAFDQQKNAVLEAVGCQPLGYFEVAHWRNELDLTKDSFEVFMSFAESSNIGPKSLDHRYLTEDVPMGLVLFSSIGKVLGISTSIADSIITLSSALLGRDFWAEGRKIQDLVEDGVTVDSKTLMSILSE